MHNVVTSHQHSKSADAFRRTVRSILVVLERLAAHAGVESNELDELVEEFFNRDASAPPHPDLWGEKE